MRIVHQWSGVIVNEVLHRGRECSTGKESVRDLPVLVQPFFSLMSVFGCIVVYTLETTTVTLRCSQWQRLSLGFTYTSYDHLFLTLLKLYCSIYIITPLLTHGHGYAELSHELPFDLCTFSNCMLCVFLDFYGNKTYPRQRFVRKNFTPLPPSLT